MFVDKISITRAQSAINYPFNVELIKNFNSLKLTKPITFIVGDNGSGKSTFLESFCMSLNMPCLGEQDLNRDPTLESLKPLSDLFCYSRRKKPRTKFFFRAEDAFGYAKSLIKEMKALRNHENELSAEFKDGSYAQKLATGVVRGQYGALRNRYGENPDAYSHGEYFMNLLMDRIKPNGLYVLDEPETPLSPQKILSLIYMLIKEVKSGSQFIIATHSPILLACPNSEIFVAKNGHFIKTMYDEVEHVSLTRDFLNAPERYIKHF